MEKSINKCSYEGCTEESDSKDKEGRCIFHSGRPDKAEDFEKAFWARYFVREGAGRVFDYANEKERRERDTFNFKGFVFPKKFLEKQDSYPFHNLVFNKKVDFEDSVFEGHLDFLRTKFRSNTTFKGAKFLGSASFGGAMFSEDGDVNFDEAKFSCADFVSFGGATFSKRGDVSFFEAIFSKGVVGFTGAKFSNKGDVRFAGASFCNEGEVSFDEAVFSNEGDVRFDDASFSKKIEVGFSDVAFSNEGEVSFNGVKFSNEGHVSFVDATFSNKGEVKFDGAIFSNESFVSFANTTFANKEEVSFLGVRFLNYGDVCFDRATFSNIVTVSFLGAKFSNNNHVSFFGVTFSNIAAVSFDRATFSEISDVTFAEAMFTNIEEVRFFGSIFTKTAEVNFSKATFSAEEIFFLGTIFSCSNLTFKSARFKGKVILQGPGKDYMFSKVSGFVDFSRASFEPKKSRFIHADLTRASFLYADIKELQFEDVIWHHMPIEIILSLPFIKRKFEFKISERQGVYDDYVLDQALSSEEPKKALQVLGISDDKNSINGRQESISAVYKQLRISYEKDLKFSEDAGDFHIAEMELRKSMPKNQNFLDSGLLSLYKLLSLYGERWWLPIFWIFFSLLSFSVFVGISNTPITEWGNYYWNWNIFPDHLRASALTLLQQATDVKVSGEVEYSKTFIGMIERVVAFILAASLVLGINRKLSRTQTKG